MWDKVYICDCQKVRTSDVEVALNYILRFALVPYRYAGDDFSGLDCSGLAVEYEKSLGRIDRDADFTAQQFYDISVKLDKPVRGCLAFYGKDVKSVSHVAIVLNDKLCFEEGGGDSTTLTVEDAKLRNAFGRVRSILGRKDLIGFGDLIG